MSPSIPHLPTEYHVSSHGGIWFYLADRETDTHKRLVTRLSVEAVDYVQDELAVVLDRQLHVCCYGSTADSRAALGRCVSPTMAMAPFSDERQCLIVIHSALLDPRNADETRLRRLLVHEIVHHVVAEKTNSTKVLGDDNANMNVASWLNEGLAEAIGLGAIGAVERLARIVQTFQSSRQFHTFEVLSRWLDDLDDERRAEAFTHVTGAVQCLIQKTGIQQVFEQLKRIGGFFQADALCTPAGMADYQGDIGHSRDTY